MTMARLILKASAALLLVACVACGKGKSPQAAAPDSIPGTTFRKDAVLTVSSSSGQTKATFDIEIAATEETTRQGLMYREKMEPGQAMLFDPQGLSRTPFWMKNTYIPLDIVFIGEDKKVMHIAGNTHPFSEDSIEPGGLYRYVLEINAGLAQKLNLNIGDTITWTNSD